jgi:dTDP-4-amino-4,6-dideoxygalactose transaminase
MPCDLGRILPLARRRGVAVVEDAACAIGSEIQWEGRWDRIGRPHGDVACFSFHPRKIISTGDGGMITTSRPDWDERFRLLRQHAMSVPDTVRHQADQIIFESYPEVGFNYRMTDIQAAVGREQLQRLREIVSRRRVLADRYAQLLSGIPGISLPVERVGVRTNWQSYCVRLSGGLEQRQVMQEMLSRRVSSRRGIMCAHREPAYADQPRPHSLRESERAQDECVLLPLYPQMADEEQELVVEVLRDACKSCAAAPVA